MSTFVVITYCVALLASLAAAILAGFPGILVFAVTCAVGLVVVIRGEQTE
jgi:hypothetical protein